MVCLIWLGVTITVAGPATRLAAAEEILGSGSTFAYPIVKQWSAEWEKRSGDRFVYQPIGSSAGVAEIRSEVVDVGISDAPLDEAQLLRDGLAQFPIVIGGIVPLVNLPGIGPGQLRFTGQLLAEIYLGKVTNWSDPAIAALNPDLKLPNRPILVIYRSDGSGTTYNWADFLSKVSDEWKVKVGVNTRLAWPVGVGAKGSGGVADSVARVSGAIGYIEYSYAVAGETGVRAGAQPGRRVRTAHRRQPAGRDREHRLAENERFRRPAERLAGAGRLPDHGDVRSP